MKNFFLFCRIHFICGHGNGQGEGGGGKGKIKT